MHFSTLVILKAEPPHLQEALENQLQVFGQAGSGEWDWWQVGGRWTGHFNGYDPEKDPVNLEPNGRVKWPTEWAPHSGDIKPVKSLTQEDLKVHTVCTPYGWHSNSRYVPWNREEPFSKQELPPLAWLQKEFPDGIAVIVDCHN
jgi:hypothetical protein